MRNRKENMKQTLHSLTATTVFALIATTTAAQYKCTDYHRFNCQPAGDSRFSENGQSKSAMVQVGRETELNIIIYSGQDYRISVCHDDKVLGEQLAIRLVEKIRVGHDDVTEVTTQEPVMDDAGNKTGTSQEVRTKQNQRVYEEVEKVLWDNTANNMANSVEFSCASSKRIAVEIVAPGNPEAKPKKKGETNDIGCVGILIEHMPTPPLGF